MPARTPSQTVGPFFHEALRWKDGARVSLATAGRHIVLTGTLFDGAGAPVADALVETWQLGPDGQAPRGATAGQPHGFGRVQTGQDGAFRIETSMPGGALPCIEVTLLARGLLKALRTRVYLAPETEVRGDPQLQALQGSPRIATLVARAQGADEFRWDVRLQGDGETVFFAP
ncbi:MAG TPA: protocatechuate 3,4-dioxygenase subunit alpha [Usitatibacter sp.]|nr:protocatechuate 3,4-dioxygenase subunit alpha [Usitatibacter sp.]